MITYEQILKKVGQYQEYSKYALVLCPFHDDHHPSLLLYKDDWFRCLSCGASGNYKRLWDKYQGWDAGTSVPEKSSWSPPSLSDNIDDQEDFCAIAHDVLSRFLPTLGWYLERRQVIDRVESCQLGWWNGWYTVPFFKHGHIFDGFVMRASLSVQQATHRRFHMPAHSMGKLYVPDWNLIDSSPYVVVVYGLFDALTLSSLRLPVVTGNCGKEGVTAELLEQFRKPIWIVPDKGEELTGRKLMNKLGWRGHLIELEYPKTCKDPNDYVMSGLDVQLRSEICGEAGYL